MSWKNYKKTRFNIIDIKFYKEFIKKTGINIDYKTFKEVIVESNAILATAIVNGNDGIRLPKNLGVVSVVKYKTNTKTINWANTKKLGTKIFNLNLNTFGFQFKIKWFRIDITKLYINRIYKFLPCRNLKRAVSKFGKENNGSKYYEWQYADFYEATRIERYMLKRANKNEEI